MRADYANVVGLKPAKPSETRGKELIYVHKRR